MRAAQFVALLLALVVFEPARVDASGGGDKPKHEKGSGFSGPRIPNIYMPPLVAPVIVGGELHHYVFLNVTLELTADGHKGMMLEKIPYVQDAFLREVHGATIVTNNDPTMLDEAGLKERLMRVCTEVVGPDIVKTVQLRHIVQASH